MKVMFLSIYRFQIFVFFALVALCFMPSGAALSVQDLDVEEVDAVVEQAVELPPFYNRTLIDQFYTERNDKLFWHQRNGRLKNDARDLIEVLEESWTHGLNPATYHVGVIKDLRSRKDYDYSVMDAVLTDGFIRYVRDLSGMRIAAKTLRLRHKDWLHPYPDEELIPFLESVKDFDDVAEMIVPKSGTYKRLQKELIKMAEEGGLDVSLPRVSFGKVVLRPGQSHRNVPALRMRLGVEASGSPRLYDDELAAAVMRFQREKGLKVDGVLGGQTVHVLNLNKRDRYKQIIANMERLRWKPEPTNERFIVVNVPSAMLWAIDGERVELEMPVVVGKPKRETEIFITYINGIRVNPDWTLPPTIKHEDIAPAAARDPDYLRKKGITVYSGYGRDAVSLDPATVQWASLSKADLKGMRMVQPPSKYNPLGQFRVLMPNQYNIYLHDTNQKRHFSLVDRARSSGCVRMSDSRAVADFVFKDSQWEGERLDGILAKGKKADLMVENKIPVYIFYYTVWIDDEARLVFGNDLYGRDARLIKELESIDGFVFPSHNG